MRCALNVPDMIREEIMVDLKNKDASERMEAGEFQSFNLNMLKKEREPKHTCHFPCKRKRITSGLISISIPVILY